MKTVRDAMLTIDQIDAIRDDIRRIGETLVQSQDQKDLEVAADLLWDYRLMLMDMKLEKVK